MSEKFWLKFTLESDAAFGRGDGLAGIVNAEIKHDAYGLPYLGGKTLKGLLVAECAEILFALAQSETPSLQKWEEAAQYLFGLPGSGTSEQARLRLGDACLAEDFRKVVIQEYRLLNEIADAKKREREWGLKQTAYLNAFTAIRQQTAVDPQSDAPLKNSLRSMRVVLRKTHFAAGMTVPKPLKNLDEKYVYGLLAACVKSFRRAGNSRSRGLGKLSASIWDEKNQDITSDWFKLFKTEVLV